MTESTWAALDVLLKHSRMTAREIAIEMQISVRQAQRIIKFLRGRHKLYIASWQRTGPRGSPSPVFAIGAAEDAPMPSRSTAAEYQRKWRERARQSRLD